MGRRHETCEKRGGSRELRLGSVGKRCKLGGRARGRREHRVPYWDDRRGMMSVVLGCSAKGVGTAWISTGNAQCADGKDRRTY